VRYESVIDAIGHTPLVKLSLAAPDGVEAYAKLELANLFAMKDRVARQVILQARRTGELAEHAPIVESSSGTMALGLALVGTHLGHPVHIVSDPRIDPVTLAKLEALGCSVHLVQSMSSQGWQSARLELLAELMADLPGAFWPRQYSNPQNPLAYRALADELIADLGTLDVIVGSVGSGGSLCGTSRALLEHLPDLRVVAVDCVGSVLFAQPDVPTRRQSGLGNSLYPENIDYRVIDEVHWLSDEEAFAATRRLAREQKIFGGNTSGSVYRVLSHLAARAEPGTRLVGILPDRGDRYVQTVYRADAAQADAAQAEASAPAEVEYGTTVKTWSVAAIPRNSRPVLLTVESNTTGTGMIALGTAVRLGFEPVLLTSDASRYQGLAQTACRVVECDTADASVLAAAAKEAAADRPIAGVTTTSEYYLQASARLAEALGLPGNPPGVMALCRDKSLCRTALAGRGLVQPQFAAVQNVAQVRHAVSEIGLPCVVKPVGESGSHDVLWCEDTNTAVAHAAKVLAVTENVRGQPAPRVALVEEYLAGREFSAEVFYAGGGAAFTGITQRTVSPLPYFVELSHLFPADIPGDLAAEIGDAARHALDAVGFARGPAHVEVKLTTKGPAIIEINARLAGGMIPELVRAATGIDLLEQQLRAATGRPVRLDPDRHRRAGIKFLTASQPGTLTSVRGLGQAERLPGVEQVALTCPTGRQVRPPRDAYDRLGYVIAVGDTPEQVQATLAAAAQMVELDIAAP
jgi:S-sulfo-L-cysteine synthase (3-phospho-L-serine-dependent)